MTLPARPPLYILQGATPVVEPNAATWEAWMKASLADGSRIVAQSNISDRLRVSTVFTGMDEDWPGSPGYERPVLFETAVFEDGELADSLLYESWQDAQAGHAKFVADLTAKA